MAEFTFLRDLAVVMAVSALTTVLFHLLRQPVVLGYLVAGVLIGPHTPPFSLVVDLHSIHTLAELGILLLLFSLGLEFDLKKLRRVGAVAVLAAILEILFMLWLGYTAGQLLGWEQLDSLFLGTLLSISSTTIIVQVLLLVVDLWGVILFLTALTVVGKIVSCSFGTFLAGYPGQVALPVGLGMAQIGEFSFIIANLGRTSGVTSGTLYPIAVAVSSVTTLLTPYLLRSAHAATAALTRFSPRPFFTFATFYTAWVARLATRAPRSERMVQGLLLRLILYVAVAVSVFVVTWSGIRPLVRALPEVLPKQSEVLQWGSAATVALPFLFLISRTLERLIQHITAALLQRRADET